MGLLKKKIYDLNLLVVGSRNPIQIEIPCNDMRLPREVAKWFDEPIGQIASCLSSEVCMREVLSPATKSLLAIDKLSEENVRMGISMFATMNHAKEHWEQVNEDFDHTWRAFYDRLAWDSFVTMISLLSLTLTDDPAREDDPIDRNKAFGLGLVRSIKSKVIFDLARLDPKRWHWNQGLEERVPDDNMASVLKHESTALRGVDVVKQLKQVLNP